MNSSITSCPFCNLPDKMKVIAENNLVIVVFDLFPVNDGHALIIPKRHFSNFFEISHEEYLAVFELIHTAKQVIDKKFNPDGYNIGVNVNEDAGQTINHCHIHLIPRYNGDVKNPRGGVRHVIPDKGHY